MPPGDSTHGPGSKPPRLRITRGDDGIHQVAFPEGNADGTAVRELYEAVVAMLDEEAPLVLVDFAGVGFVGSGMLGMLVTVLKKARQAGGTVAIAVDDPLVRKTMRVTQLDRVLRVYPDASSARAALADRLS
ncbi:MAG: STAS domain-containing protein [Planctomycetota bacterium]